MGVPWWVPVPCGGRLSSKGRPVVVRTSPRLPAASQSPWDNWVRLCLCPLLIHSRQHTRAQTQAHAHPHPHTHAHAHTQLGVRGGAACTQQGRAVPGPSISSGPTPAGPECGASQSVLGWQGSGNWTGDQQPGFPLICPPAAPWVALSAHL